MDQAEWETLTPEEKRVELYLRQKQMLDTFLKNGAISREQYEISLGGLTEKMGMQAYRDARDREASDPANHTER